MIEKYDAVARQSGSRIAIHCGQAWFSAGEGGPILSQPVANLETFIFDIFFCLNWLLTSLQLRAKVEILTTSFWGKKRPIFRGGTVSFREGIELQSEENHHHFPHLSFINRKPLPRNSGK